MEETQPLGKLIDRLSQPAQLAGRRVRALNPLAEKDAALLHAVGRGEFLLNGFRNGNLRSLLFPNPPDDPIQRRRQAAAVTRLLRLLRAHGIIRKIPKTHRYLVTDKGRQVITALQAARHADVIKLTQAA